MSKPKGSHPELTGKKGCANNSILSINSDPCFKLGGSNLPAVLEGEKSKDQRM